MKSLLKKKSWQLVLAFSLLFLGATFFIFGSLNKNSSNVFNSILLSHELKNSVPIAMAADDNYTYPTIVSITSLLENSDSSTSYDIYIMTPGDFLEENKQKLLSLQEKNKDKCKINLINMKDNYKNANVAGHGNTPLTTPAYYRLSLPSLLSEFDKVIWVDGDTLIFEDLTNLININMNGFYYKGFLDFPFPMDCFNFTGDHYICSGVMLINLEKLRQDNMEKTFETFIKENNDKLVQHDQTVINVVCHENIGALPAKYGIFNWENNEIEHYFSKLVAKNKYTKEEVYDAHKNPAILHYVNKPWTEKDVNRKSLWWDYAEKTGYIDEIKVMYGFN